MPYPAAFTAPDIPLLGIAILYSWEVKSGFTTEAAPALCCLFSY
jgi:hypothetical protein